MFEKLPMHPCLDIGVTLYCTLSAFVELLFTNIWLILAGNVPPAEPEVIVSKIDVPVVFTDHIKLSNEPIVRLSSASVVECRLILVNCVLLQILFERGVRSVLIPGFGFTVIVTVFDVSAVQERLL